MLAGGGNLQSKICSLKFLDLQSLVMMVLMLGFADRNHAAMGDFADGVFELDRSVIDFEVVLEAELYITQDLFTLRRGNVGDGDVAGKSA